MRKKEIKKHMISDFLTITLLFNMFVNTVVYADGGDDVYKILEDVATVLLTVAGLFCVGKLLQIGIKFMTSSIEEKSNAKMALLPWIIGTIVCFGAAWIGKLIINVIGGANTNKPVLEY